MVFVKNIMLLGSSLHVGGAERVIANLARYVDPSRFNIVVCHLKEQGSIGADLEKLGYPVVGVPSIRHGIRRYLSFRALDQVLKEYRIDVVHTHTTYALTDASLCRYLGRWRIRLVHTFHFGNYPYLPLRYRMLEWAASRLADRLVAVGQEQLQAISKSYGLAPRRLNLILNGVEAINPKPDADWNDRLRTDNRIVIGTICTFIEQKGLPDLLRVAQTLKTRNERVLFIVVGDGPLRRGLESQCAESGLKDTVVFSGWKQEAAATMMPLFDVFFQPSLWEAMSMVVLEAMAAGKPVVVTDVGDNRHVVQHDETGYIVPARDVDAMVTALLALIHSDERRAAFSRAGRLRYEENYTVRTMTKCYETVYSQVLDGFGKERYQECVG